MGLKGSRSLNYPGRVKVLIIFRLYQVNNAYCHSKQMMVYCPYFLGTRHACSTFFSRKDLSLRVFSGGRLAPTQSRSEKLGS